MGSAGGRGEASGGPGLSQSSAATRLVWRQGLEGKAMTGKRASRLVILATGWQTSESLRIRPTHPRSLCRPSTPLTPQLDGLDRVYTPLAPIFYFLFPISYFLFPISYVSGVLTLRMVIAIIIGMKKTLIIDAAGRLVLPKPIRDRFRLGRGSGLDLEVSPDAIILRPARPGPTLVEEQGLLVHEGKPSGDLLRAVEDARLERDNEIMGPLR